MASVTSALPKLFRWAFTIFAILMVFGAIAVSLAILIDPRVPTGLHFAPKGMEFAGQPMSLILRAQGGDYDFTLTALRGSLILFVQKAGGLIEVFKHFGLPVVLLNLVFFAVLFDLLRRLFRNVGRGESFTAQSVRLVQYVGGTLIVFSLVSAFAENWFVHAVYGYLASHATVTVSGTQLHLPAPRDRMFPHMHGPFGSPVFFSGLLVLALSEVFRQGLALKTENDLTV